MMPLVWLYIILQVAEALFKDLGFEAAAVSAGHYAYCVGVAIIVLFPLLVIFALLKDDK